MGRQPGGPATVAQGKACGAAGEGERCAYTAVLWLACRFIGPPADAARLHSHVLRSQVRGACRAREEAAAGCRRASATCVPVMSGSKCQQCAPCCQAHAPATCCAGLDGEHAELEALREEAAQARLTDGFLAAVGQRQTPVRLLDLCTLSLVLRFTPTTPAQQAKEIVDRLPQQVAEAEKAAVSQRVELERESTGTCAAEACQAVHRRACILTLHVHRRSA